MSGISGINSNAQTTPLLAPAGKATASAESVQQSIQMLVMMGGGSDKDVFVLMSSQNQTNTHYHAGNAADAYQKNSTLDGAAAAGGGAAD